MVWTYGCFLLYKTTRSCGHYYSTSITASIRSYCCMQSKLLVSSNNGLQNCHFPFPSCNSATMVPDVESTCTRWGETYLVMIESCTNNKQIFMQLCKWIFHKYRLYRPYRLYIPLGCSHFDCLHKSVIAVWMDYMHNYTACTVTVS